MHVLEHVPDPEGWLRAPVVTEQLRAGEQDVRKRLRAVVPDDARRWCRPDALVARGKPYREILHVASERC
jgi:hypothetical protein